MAIFLAVIAMSLATVHSQVIHGGLSPWTNSGVCSVTCGSGTQNQIRTCTAPSPGPGGDPCDPEEPTSRTAACNTQDCPAACSYNKPCTCEDVTKYVTGTEPNLTLVHFAGIVPGDLDMARSYLMVWRQDIFDEFCKALKCSMVQIDAGIANITGYVNDLVSLDTSYKTATAMMRDVINCNSNVEIERNLWQVYDFLCDRSVALNEIKKDLMQKKTMLESEKERCEGRGWFSGFVESFYKKW